MADGGRAQGDRAQGARPRRRSGAVRPGLPGTRPERAVDGCAGAKPRIWPDVRAMPRAVEARRAETVIAMATEVLMPALSPTMTEGKIARWLKSEGEQVQRRRRARRDRDRQGDDGGRGGRRGHPRQDRDPRRHRARRGQHPDRGDRRQRRGCRRAAPPGPTGREPPAAAACRRQSRAPQPAPRRPRQRAAPPRQPAEPEYTGATATITVREALARRDRRGDAARRDACS